MGITINLVNDSNIDLVKNATDEQLEQAFIAIASSAEAYALVEVDKLVYQTPESPNYTRTYRLRDNITSASDGRSAVVGTDVEYAPYVEYGSRGMHARPFLRNAVENHVDYYQKVLETYLSHVPDQN